MKLIATCVFSAFFGILVSAQQVEKLNAEIQMYQKEYIISAPGKAVEIHFVRVLNYNGDTDFDELSVHYSKNEKVSSISARILDLNGKELRKFKKSDVQDVMVYTGNLIDDNRVKVLDMKYGVYPHILEYSYEKEYDESVIVEYFSPCQPFTKLVKAQFKATYPKGMGVKYKWMSSVTADVDLTDAGGNEVLEVALNDLPPTPAIRSGSDPKSILPSFYFVPEEFNFDGYKGNFKDWTSFGNFITQLNEPQEKITPEIQATVNRLVSGVQDNKEKISRLYRHLQENFRYVSIQLGIGGWRAFDAEYVHKNNYGDCKALSNYMKTLLKAASIPAHLVLVGAGDVYISQEEAFANPSFNHMILYVPGEDVWLECTSKSLPAGFLGKFTAGRNTLICNGKESHLKRTPELTLEDNTQETDLQLSLRANGKNELRVKQSFGKEIANDVYEAWVHSKKEDFETIIHNHFNVPGAQLDSVKYDYQKGTGIGILTYVFPSLSVGSKTGKRTFIPLQAFIEEEKTALLKRPSESGVAQAYIQKFPIRNKYTLQINLDPGVLVEAMPADQQLKFKDLAAFEIKSEKQSGYLKISTDFVFKQGTVTASELQELQAFLVQVQKVINSKLVLVQGP